MALNTLLQRDLAEEVSRVSDHFRPKRRPLSDVNSRASKHASPLHEDREDHHGSDSPHTLTPSRISPLTPPILRYRRPAESMPAKQSKPSQPVESEEPSKPTRDAQKESIPNQPLALSTTEDPVMKKSNNVELKPLVSKGPGASTKPQDLAKLPKPRALATRSRITR